MSGTRPWRSCRGHSRCSCRHWRPAGKIAVSSATAPRSGSRREAVLLDQREDFGGGFGDVRAGAVDRADPGLFQEIIVLGRDDAADDDEDVAGTLTLQGFDQRRDKGFVTGSMGRYADDVDVVLDRLARRLF